MVIDWNFNWWYCKLPAQIFIKLCRTSGPSSASFFLFLVDTSDTFHHFKFIYRMHNYVERLHRNYGMRYIDAKWTKRQSNFSTNDLYCMYKFGFENCHYIWWIINKNQIKRMFDQGKRTFVKMNDWADRRLIDTHHLANVGVFKVLKTMSLVLLCTLISIDCQTVDNRLVIIWRAKVLVPLHCRFCNQD